MARDLTYLRIDTLIELVSVEYTSPAVIVQFTSTLFVNHYLFYYEKKIRKKMCFNHLFACVKVASPLYRLKR